VGKQAIKLSRGAFSFWWVEVELVDRLGEVVEFGEYEELPDFP
jgi:hypothetical protein